MKVVLMYDKLGQFISEYKSVTAATQATGIGYSSIQNSCKYGVPCGDYNFKYMNEKKKKTVVPSLRAASILHINLEPPPPVFNPEDVPEGLHLIHLKRKFPIVSYTATGKIKIDYEFYKDVGKEMKKTTSTKKERDTDRVMMPRERENNTYTSFAGIDMGVGVGVGMGMTGAGYGLGLGMDRRTVPWSSSFDNISASLNATSSGGYGNSSISSSGPIAISATANRMLSSLDFGSGSGSGNGSGGGSIHGIPILVSAMNTNEIARPAYLPNGNGNINIAKTLGNGNIDEIRGRRNDDGSPTLTTTSGFYGRDESLGRNAVAPRLENIRTGEYDPIFNAPQALRMMMPNAHSYTNTLAHMGSGNDFGAAAAMNETISANSNSRIVFDAAEDEYRDDGMLSSHSSDDWAPAGYSSDEDIRRRKKRPKKTAFSKGNSVKLARADSAVSILASGVPMPMPTSQPTLVDTSINWYYRDNAVVATHRTTRVETTFESASAAARALNLNHSSISKCCRKKQKHCGGYFFSYAYEKDALREAITQKEREVDRLLRESFLQSSSSSSSSSTAAAAAAASSSVSRSSSSSSSTSSSTSTATDIDIERNVAGNVKTNSATSALDQLLQLTTQLPLDDLEFH